jgi:hypothetical protein
VSYRDPGVADEAAALRDLDDRLRRIESGAGLSGRVGVGALRIGGFAIEINAGNGDLQIRRLSDNATTLLMAD